MKSRQATATAQVMAILHLVVGGLLAAAPLVLLLSLHRFIPGAALLTLVAIDVVSAALLGVAIWALEGTSRKEGVLKYVVGFGLGLLLVLALFAGAISFRAAPVAVGVWLITLGVRISRPRAGIYETTLLAHRLLLVFGVLFVVWGAWALRAAELSARRGGGLLGGFGLIPIALGGLFLTLSVPMLLWLRTETARSLLSAARSGPP